MSRYVYGNFSSATSNSPVLPLLAVLAIAICGRPENVFAQPLPRSHAALPQPHKAPAAGGFEAKVEAKMGRPLSPDQKTSLVEASRKQVQELQPIQAAFAQQIAQIVSLPVTEITPMLPRIGQDNAGFDKNMIPKLETRLGRKLAPTDLEKIRTADTNKKTSMQTVRNRFVSEVGKITGLPPADVESLLPKIGL